MYISPSIYLGTLRYTQYIEVLAQFFQCRQMAEYNKETESLPPKF